MWACPSTTIVAPAGTLSTEIGVVVGVSVMATVVWPPSESVAVVSRERKESSP